MAIYAHVITGIWDVMTNEEVVEFVRSAIAEGTLPDIVSPMMFY